jgi:hypothetical protein
VEARRQTRFNLECRRTASVPCAGHARSLLIIRDAFLGFRRFGEFQKHLGCAKNIACWFIAPRLSPLP